MELTNEFRVSVPIDQAWAVLTDLEQVAPCMPGALLEEVEGDEYRGVVKVKVGPITTQYKGIARLIEQDDVAHRAVLRAEGRETRGQGNASATVTANLTPDGDGTMVSILTDLSISGKVAQFGRGVLADVSAKLLEQFAESLEASLTSGEGKASDVDATSSNASEGAAPDAVPSQSKSSTDRANGDSTTSADGNRPTVRAIRSEPVEPVDLLDAAGVPFAKRLLPAAGAALVVAGWAWRRRRKRRAAS